MPPYGGTGAGCGQGALRDMQGRCDLCGEDCYPNDELCVALSCNSLKCDCEVFHQGCLEKYLKSHRLESNRKTGFQCPRGFSKFTAASERCRGKIDKSHPIVPRNEKKVAAKVVPPQVVMAQNKAEEAKRREQIKAQQAAAAKKRALPGLVPRKAPPASRPPRVAPAPQPQPVPEPEPEAPAGPKELPPGFSIEMVLNKAQLKRLKKKEARARAAEQASACTGATEGSIPDPSEWGGASSAAAGEAGERGGGGGEGEGEGGARRPANALLATNAFVRDVDSYNRLLGLYMADSSDDEDGEEDDDDSDEAGGSEAGGAAGSASGGGDASLAPAGAGGSSGSESSFARASGSGGGAGGSGGGFESDVAAAVEASAAAAQAGLAAEIEAERAALAAYASARPATPPWAHGAPPPIPVPVPIPVPTPLPAPAPAPAHAAPPPARCPTA